MPYAMKAGCSGCSRGRRQDGLRQSVAVYSNAKEQSRSIQRRHVPAGLGVEAVHLDRSHAASGRLDLDKDVNTYLDFKIPEKFGNTITPGT
jgi:hypothetical protein